MLTAQLNCADISGCALITVEVLKAGPRPGTMWVRALGGLKPFTRFTHGGPSQEGIAVVNFPQLQNLQEYPCLPDKEHPWTP
jgi:hypothetical protein